MGAAAEVFDGWRLWSSVSIAIGHVEDWPGVVQVGGHHLLFPGPLGAEVGEVVADLGSVPVPQAGLLGRNCTVVATRHRSLQSHQAGAAAVSADELHGWHERGADRRRSRPAQQICHRCPGESTLATTSAATVGRHSTAIHDSAALPPPQQAAASGRPSLRSSNQAPRLRKKVLAGCCHSAWLLTGHAQLPRPNASAIRAAGTGSTKPRAARNTNSAASRGQQGGGEGGAVPPPETVVFDIDEQVEHGVHRQPGERRADAKRVDVHLRKGDYIQ